MIVAIGFHSMKDCLYWWSNNEYRAFWYELNSGYYQLNPDIAHKDFFFED